jgi:hypothetical protein
MPLLDALQDVTSVVLAALAFAVIYLLLEGFDRV